MSDVASLCRNGQDAIQSRQYQNARGFFLEALEAAPDDPDAHYGLATTSFLQGDFLGAAHHFRQVARHDPRRAGAFINLGAIYNRLDRPQDAVAMLRRGLQLDPERAEGYYNLGLVYRRIGQDDLAAEAYAEAVRLRPDMADAHYNLANVLLEANRFSEAVEHYQKALDLRPDWPEAAHGLDMAEEAAADSSLIEGDDTSTEAAAAPEGPVIHPVDDPQGIVDPNRHKALLREFQQLCDGARTLGAEVGDVAPLERVLRDLSSALLLPETTRTELKAAIDRFAETVAAFRDQQTLLRNLRNQTHAFAGRVR